MICGKCDQTIRDGEQYTTYDIPAASGPGVTVHWHVLCPDRTDDRSMTGGVPGGGRLVGRGG